MLEMLFSEMVSLHLSMSIQEKNEVNVKKKMFRSDQLQGAEAHGYWLYLLHRCRMVSNHVYILRLEK